MSVSPLHTSFEQAEDRSVWPAPDKSILDAGRRPPVPMPAGLFGDAWSMLQDFAAGSSTPVDYSAVSFLGCCASLIGGKRKVRPFNTASWSEPCILWFGAVGDPSSRKSPSLDAITDPMRAIEQDHAGSHKENLHAYEGAKEWAKASRAEWEKEVKVAVKEGREPPFMPEQAAEPEKPGRRRPIVMDATPEALGAILASNPMGTLHFRDELAGWLTSFDRYAEGGRAFWLEAYGGRPFVIDRKNLSGPLSIPFNGVSVLGGIQPAKLADALLNGPDDGLVARFLWAWPEKQGFARPTTPADPTKLERIYRRLDSLGWAVDPDGKAAPVVLPLTAQAADLFEAWAKENAELDSDASALFKSFVGKMDGAVLRLSLVAELVDWAINGGSERREVSARSVAAAAEWVEDYAKPMALRVYGDAALPRSERNAAVLARYILKMGMKTINKRELKRSPHKSALPDMRKAEALDAAIEHLVDGGWLMAIETNTGGRPAGTYSVNPAVRAFAK